MEPNKWIPALGAALLLASTARPAHAWVYPEHRDIAVLAIEGLDPERRAQFDRLWSEARAGNENRLCAAGADVGQGVAPACIDWAAMSAISGDHSCSSAQMLDTVLQSDWILAVADVAAQFKLDLARIEEGPAAKPGGQGITPIRDIRRELESEAVAGRTRQHRAGRRHPAATRGSRVRDARGFEQRTFPAGQARLRTSMRASTWTPR